MAPPPRIPAGLRSSPFSLAEAKAAGLSPTALRGKSWIRLDRGLYCRAGVTADLWKILAAYQRLIPDSIFAGVTAGWLLGLDLEPRDPLEIIVPPSSGMRSARHRLVRRALVTPAEIISVKGLLVTSASRTLADICARFPRVEALALLDAAMRMKLTDRRELMRSNAMCVRALAPLAEPAESPMETRLRWLFLKAGLPRPEVQRDLQDFAGRFVGRADLYYADARLVIEFDGGNHRDRLVEDDRRQNAIVNAGYTVLRFTSSDIFNRPETIVAQVSAAAAASATPPAAARR